MAEFAEDEELDLGEIGKFKVSFLEEFMKLYPSPVENSYVERLESYDRRIKQQGEFKIGFFCSLSRLYEKTEDMRNNIIGRNKLIKDFEKYFTKFPTRQGRVHYHRKY